MYKNLYTDIHSSKTQNSEKVEIAPKPIKWGMHKQDMVYVYNGIVFRDGGGFLAKLCSTLVTPWAV